MIRFLFRLLGFLVLAAGFVALVADGARSIAAGALRLTSTEQAWALASADGLASAKTAIAGLGSPGVADPAFAWTLATPACAALIVIGLLLMIVGRRPRPRVGVAP
ncbi:hypothetical protein GCM10008171_26890 [Methylopila jiangsuensis]|uniref:PetM family of cytochrome b6f complex subunit 7 n=1 Tax=Methylopila jiangsuensis TaxID=586230 RepID=A0A9W6JKB1_9HYPH|nr:hypothetical protein [Methylopila jiangsuensis]MDR6285176.1 hypothetical protein [Methylopila jiangsuensis]GLK77435.1 hypothetical protein GCM10008171_26890 [Methylopila jiangsuensis]